MEIIIEKVPRTQLVADLVVRDGSLCQHPDCNKPMDLSLGEGPMQATIDHWVPQIYGKENGWTRDEIWDLSNLKLMHRKCNAKKGDMLPNEDGTLPEKIRKTFRYRRDKRATRPDLCVSCDNGHNLFADEVCGACGCNAQRFPRSAKVRYDECDHEIMWCWVCSITPEMRPSSIGTAIRHADADELGEWLDEGDNVVVSEHDGYYATVKV